MAQTVRAIYEHGHLRLLDDVALAEGQQVRLVFLADRQPTDQIVRAILIPDGTWSEHLEESDIVAIAEGLAVEDPNRHA